MSILRYVVLLCVAFCLQLNCTAQVNLEPAAGWEAFPIVSQGENISAVSDAGYGNLATLGTYDGLGAHLDGGDLKIWLNHETTPGAISRVVLDLANFEQAIQSTLDQGQTNFPTTLLTEMGYSYSSIFDGTYHAINNPNPVATGPEEVESYSDSNFARFCSGTSYAPNSFGPNRGFVDELYMTGEEVNGGNFYVLDENTRELWEATDMGAARWENGALVDTGETAFVAFLLLADESSSPGAPIQMYVGEKGFDANSDGVVDLLERNGLRGGTNYYFDPDAGFSETDLPDGTVSGTWTTDINDALFETKLEDIHTSPFDGTQVIFADQTDGLYRMQLNLVFDSSGLVPGSSTTTIFQIVDDDTGVIGAPDNLVWARNDSIYVQNDGSGDTIYQMDSDGSNIRLVATAFSEPSGIIDVSELVGREPGRVLLSSVQGSGGTSGAQLVALVNTRPLPFVPPSTYSLIRGVEEDVSVSYFQESDNVFASIRPGFILNSTEAPVWIEFDAVAQAAGYFRVESNAGTPGLEFTIEAWNWNTSVYEIVGIQAESFNEDEVVEFPIVSGDHVDSDGGVRSRVGWRRVGFTIVFPWEVRIDQVGWGS